MPKNLSDEFFNGLANAIDDIRQKVVEEPFFGRAVTDKGPDVPRWPEAKEMQPEQSREQERERDREPDIER
jgi:hypothetical protein